MSEFKSSSKEEFICISYYDTEDLPIDSHCIKYRNIKYDIQEVLERTDDIDYVISDSKTTRNLLKENDKLKEEIERLKEQLNDEIQEELKQSEIMVKKQQEIERLNNIDRVNDIVYEEQKHLIKMWKNKYYEKKEEIERLHYIIKEVREYIKTNCLLSDTWEELENHQFIPTGRIYYKSLNGEKIKELLEILDKE